jgi:NADPH-dependent ferric siderophore reductase
MTRTNMSATRVKPAAATLLTLRVLCREQLSPHFVRVTFGDGDVDRFTAMGFDQWFRLFLPVASEQALTRLPNKLTALAYAKYLTIAKTERPVLRNYSVRAFRSDGPELDVDFVVHGDGPAATWALNCKPGDAVAIIDEGIAFTPPPSAKRMVLVADESGVPAAAAVLASLPLDTVGHAILEIPEDADRQDLVAPLGVTVEWLPRNDSTARPGVAALAEARALSLPGPATAYGWSVGEAALPTGLRRHWVGAGVPKNQIMFCGYWRW